MVFIRRMLADNIQDCTKKGRLPISLFLGICVLILFGCSHQEKRIVYHHYQVDTQVISHSDIPLVVNEKVVTWVDYFAGPGRKAFANSLRRSGRYAPMIRKILSTYGVPQDLIYLALIESGFSTTARSPAEAVGLWQFIQETGKRYGLVQNNWIDERQDAEKATHAAAKYLKDLHAEFGDWYLALAAYNSGEKTVRKAISRYNSGDYWTLSDSRNDAFRTETQDYVPKYIAAAIVAKNPSHFGFVNIPLDPPVVYDEVVVDTQVDIDVIAKCAGVSKDTVSQLNSELKTGSAPARHRIKLPKGTSEGFKLALSKVSPKERVAAVKKLPPQISDIQMVSMRKPAIISHKVKEGDTLLSISKQHSISQSQIKRLAQLYNGELQPGDIITLRID